MQAENSWSSRRSDVKLAGQQELDALERAVQQARNVDSNGISAHPALAIGALEASAQAVQTPGPNGTPWTVTNAALPAYPAYLTPQLPFKAEHGSRPSPVTPVEGMQQHHHMSGSTGPSPTGAAAVPTPGIPVDYLAPVQEGALLGYPELSFVDQKGKWQRIQNWVDVDSMAALEAKPRDSLALTASIQLDDVRSVDSTLLELEIARASAQKPPLASSAPARSHLLAMPAATGDRPGLGPQDTQPSVDQLLSMISAATGAQTKPGSAAIAQGLLPGGKPGLSNPVGLSYSFGAAGMTLAGPPPSLLPVGSVQLTKGVDIMRGGLSSAPSIAAPVLSPTWVMPGTTVPALTAARTSASLALPPELVAERTALEARASAAEQQLNAAQKTAVAEVEKLRERVATLEAALASERGLVGRLQEQLTGELQRAQVLGAHEAQARAAEASVREMLEMTKKSLEAERRRSSEQAKLAAATAAEEREKVAAAQNAKAALERRWQEEKDQRARLQRQLGSASKLEQELRTQLGRSDQQCLDQGRHLEKASTEVAAMRSELQMLHNKLAARDEQLLKHVEEVETQQMAVLTAELESCNQSLRQHEQHYGVLRQCFVAVHQCLSPQALAAAFSYSEEHLQAFQGSSEDYRAATARLMGGQPIDQGDAQAMVHRVRQLLQQTSAIYLAAEKQEVALRSELDGTLDTLRQQCTQLQAKLTEQQHDHDARMATCTAALRTATQRVEELMQELGESQEMCAALQGQQVKASLAEQLQKELEEKIARCTALEREVEAWQTQAAQANVRAQTLVMQQQEVEAAADKFKSTAEAKEERIRELRNAMTSALEERAVVEQQLRKQLAEMEGRCQELTEQQQQVQQHASALQQQLSAKEQTQGAISTRLQQLDQQLQEVQAASAATEHQLQQQSLHIVQAAQLVLDSLLQAGAGQAPPQSSALQGGLSADGKLFPVAAEDVIQRATAAVADLQTALSHHGARNTESEDASNITQLLADAASAMVSQLAFQMNSTSHHCSTLLANLQEAHNLLEQSQALAKQSTQHISASPTSTHHSTAGSSSSTSHSAASRSTVLWTSPAEAAVSVAVRVEGQANTLYPLLQDLSEHEASLRQQVADLEAELLNIRSNTQKEFGSLKGEVVRAVQAADKANEELKRQFSGREAQLTSQLAAVAAARDQALIQARTLQDELDQTAQQLTKLRQQHFELQQQAEAGQVQLHQAEAARAELEEQLERYKASVDQLRLLAGPREKRLATMTLRMKLAVQRRAAAQKQAQAASKQCRQLEAKLATATEQLRHGAARLRKLAADHEAAAARVVELEARCQRSDNLVQKMDDRRSGLEAERKILQDKISKLTAQLADATKTAEIAGRSEAAARRDLVRVTKSQLQPAEERGSALLQQLEAAELALRESQGTATRLLQETELLREQNTTIRAELEAQLAESNRQVQELQHQLELSQAVPGRGTHSHSAPSSPTQSTASMSQAAGGALVPAHSTASITSTNTLGAKEQLLAQLCTLQTANVELAAAKAAAEAECHHVRRRLRRAEAAANEATSQLAASEAGHPDDVSVCSVSTYRHSRVTADMDATALQSAMHAKEQRISELRSALASSLAERAVLQRQLEESGSGHGGGGGNALQLQQELVEVRSQLLTAEKRLFECQQQLNKAQAAQAASEQQVQQIAFQLQQAKASADMQLQQLSSSQQQLASAVNAVRSELQTHQQKAVIGYLTSLEQCRSALEESQTLRKALEDRYSSTEAELGASRTRISVLKTEMSTVIQQLEAAKDELEAAHRAQHVVEIEKDDLQQRVQELTAQLEQLQGELEQHQQAAEAASEENTELAEQLAIASAEVSNLQQQLEIVGSIRMHHQQAAEESMHRVKRLEAQYQEAQDEIANLKSQVSALGAQVCEFGSAKDGIQSQLHSAREQLSESERRWQQCDAELAAVRNQLVVAERQLADAESEWRRAEAELASARLQHDELEMLLAETEEQREVQDTRSQALQVENQQLHDQCHSLQQQLHDIIMQRAADAGNTQNTLPGTSPADPAQQPASRGSADSAHLVAGSSSERQLPAPSDNDESVMTGSVQLLPTKSSELADQLRQQVWELETEVSTLQGELSRSQGHASALEQECEMVKLQQEAADSRWKSSHAMVSELQQQLAEVSSSTAAELAGLRAKVLELEMQRDELAARHDSSQFTERQVVQQLQDAQAQVEAELHRAMAAEQQLLQQKDAAEKLAEELANLKLQLQDARLAAGQHESVQIQQLQERLQQSEQRAHEHASSRSRLTQELEDSNTALQQAEDSVIHHTEAIKKLHAELATVEQQLGQAQAQLSSREEAVAKLQQELSGLQGTCQGLEQEVQQWQDVAARHQTTSRSTEARVSELRAEVELLHERLEAAMAAGSQTEAAYREQLRQLHAQLSEATARAAGGSSIAAELAATQKRAVEAEGQLEQVQHDMLAQQQLVATLKQQVVVAQQQLAAQAEEHKDRIADLKGSLAAAHSLAEHSQRQLNSQESRMESYVHEVSKLKAQLDASVTQLQKEKMEAAALRAERNELSLRFKELSVHRSSSTALPDPDHHDNADAMSDTMSMVSTTSQVQQLHNAVGENRDLMAKLANTHRRLKMTKAQLAQSQAALQHSEAQVQSLLGRSGQSHAASGNSNEPDVSSTPRTNEVATLKAELNVYKGALLAAQEESASATAMAAEAQARLEVLQQQQMHLDAAWALRKSRSTFSRGPSRAPSRTGSLRSSPTKNETLRDQSKPIQSGGNGPEYQVLVEMLESQRREISTLKQALDTANDKRAASAQEAAKLATVAAQAEKKEHLLDAKVKELSQHLAQLQQRYSDISKASLLSESASWSSHSHVTSGPSSRTSSAAGSLSSREASSSGGGSSSQRASSTHMEVIDEDASDGAPESRLGAALAAASMSKLEQVVATWRDTCQAKDQQMQQLQKDLEMTAHQLVVASEELTASQSKAAQLEEHLTVKHERLSASEQHARAHQEALERQLRSKEGQVKSLEARVASFEADLQVGTSSCEQLQRQLAAAHAEVHAARQQLHGSDLSLEDMRHQAAQHQAEAKAATRQIEQLQHELESAHAKGSSLQERLSATEAEVLRVADVLRSLLIACSSSFAQLQEPVHGSHRSCTAQLQELVDVLAAELNRRSTILAEATGRCRAQEAVLQQREDELRALETRLKSQTEKIFQQSAQLQGAVEETSRLQASLRRKESDLAVIQTEIQRQMSDYQRLKDRLVQQERDGSRLASDQDVMVRKCDELQGALSAKQEECGMAAVRVTQLQEQLTAARQAQAAVQDRLRALELQQDSSARQQAQAAVQIQSLQEEIKTSHHQAQLLRDQLDKKTAEIRELHQMLKAWEAMRLGKDAQIAALMERCKRNEEDVSEKARTVEALRRKLLAIGRSSIASGPLGLAGGTGAGAGAGAGERLGGMSSLQASTNFAQGIAAGHALDAANRGSVTASQQWPASGGTGAAGTTTGVSQQQSSLPAESSGSGVGSLSGGAPLGSLHVSTLPQHGPGYRRYLAGPVPSSTPSAVSPAASMSGSTHSFQGLPAQQRDQLRR